MLPLAAATAAENGGGGGGREPLFRTELENILTKFTGGKGRERWLLRNPSWMNVHQGIIIILWERQLRCLSCV